MLAPLFLVSCTSTIKNREELKYKYKHGITKLYDDFRYYGFDGEFDIFKLRGETLKIPCTFTQFGYPLVYPDMRFDFKSFKQSKSIEFTKFPYKKTQNGFEDIFVPKSEIIDN